MDGPYALAADGTAKDPQAFQQALRQDAEKLGQLEQVGTVVLQQCISLVARTVSILLLASFVGYACNSWVSILTGLGSCPPACATELVLDNWCLQDPQLKAALLGEDVAAMQELLKQAYEVSSQLEVIPYKPVALVMWPGHPWWPCIDD